MKEIKEILWRERQIQKCKDDIARYGKIADKYKREAKLRLVRRRLKTAIRWRDIYIVRLGKKVGSIGL